MIERGIGYVVSVLAKPRQKDLPGDQTLAIPLLLVLLVTLTLVVLFCAAST